MFWRRAVKDTWATGGCFRKICTDLCTMILGGGKAVSAGGGGKAIGGRSSSSRAPAWWSPGSETGGRSIDKLLAETPETVTISRADLDTLIDAAENAEDIASVRAWKAYVASVGRDAANANSYTGAEAKRLLD